MSRTRRSRGRLVRRAWLVALVASLIAPAAASAVRVVYVTNAGAGAENRRISALEIKPDGTLSPVSGSPFLTGSTTGELDGVAVTPDAGHVYAAMAFDNAVYGWTILGSGGLTPAPSSPFATGAPNPLDVSPRPDGSRLYVNNHTAPQSQQLGVWAIAADGSLSQIFGSPFTGKNTNAFPMILAPDGNHLYTPNENGVDQDTVTAWSLSASGAPTEIQTIATGDNPFGGGITPNGRFLYVSNPEDNGARGTISGFTVAANGTLSAVPGTKFPTDNAACPAPPGCGHPLNVAITPDSSRLYVVNRIGASVAGFNINADGSLSAIPGSPFATSGTNPRSLALTPDAKRLYVANENGVTGFDVLGNGSLTTIPGSPFATGGTRPNLEAIAITPNQPPTAAFTMHTGFAGRPTGFDATGSSDSDGRVKTYDWDFGDGTALPNGGPIPNHIYDHPGNYFVQLTVTDNEGCSATRIFTGKATLCNGSPVATATQLVTVKRDSIAPRFLRAAVTPSQFSTATTFKYSLTEAAKVVFTIQRKAKGRRVNGKCVPQTAANRSHPSCTRYKALGSFSQQGDAGPNVKRFSGKIGNKRLAPGRYRVKLVATDSAGNHSAPTFLNIRVVGASAGASR